jgi:cell division protein FtsW
MLFIRILKIAENCPDKFGKLLAVGIGSWFIVQAFINISAMVGLAPLTGIPLLFVSHGGTAMAIGMAAFGILINISRQTNLPQKNSDWRRK